MSVSHPSLSAHARRQLARRNLDERLVHAIVAAPDETIAVRPGREIRQSVVLEPGTGKTYLVRVIIDSGPYGTTIVTAYRTSKLAKYEGRP